MLRCRSGLLNLCSRRPFNGLTVPYVEAGARNFTLEYGHDRRASNLSDSVPRVIQPSLWSSLVPKFLRKSQNGASPATGTKQAREWNPATVFIVMFMLVGSNAINMIALRNDLKNFNSKADARIRQLQNVIERVQRGEDVNVEEELGTGDEAREKEWEDFLKEVEIEAPSKSKKAAKVAPNEEKAERTDKANSVELQTVEAKQVETTATKPQLPARFY